MSTFDALHRHRFIGKTLALDLDRTASDIMEEAGKQWLQSKTKKG